MKKNKNKKIMTKNKNNPSLLGACKTSAFSSKSLELIKGDKEKLHKIFNKSLVCLMIVFMLSYLVSINDLSIKGFIIEDMKSNISELEIDNETYELEAMTLESYELLDQRAQKLGMVKVDDIKYVTFVDGVVAVK